MTNSPFDPNSPFDMAVEDLRTSICLGAAAFMQQHKGYLSLSQEQQAQVIFIALAVSSVGILQSMVIPPAYEEIVTAFVEYMPTAQEIVADIRANFPKGNA